MPIKSIKSDPETLTLTAVYEHSVDVQRLFDAWRDPRKLERFWGPPTWPATFVRHEMRVGSRSHYFMTGPKGETSHGYWIVDEVQEGRRFVVRDGFANPDGSANEAFPQTKMEITFEAIEGGARFTSVSTFASLEAMEKLIAMGMVEGLTQAMGQIDEVVADLREFAAGFRTELQLLDDTTALVERVVRGPLTMVWRAHHEEELVQKWLLGPDGWTMPVCQLAKNVGDTYRYEWENAESGERFGFEGELLESEAPRRSVTTESMIGMDGPGTKNELTLTPLPGSHTRISIRIEYPSKEVRDMILATGMVDGMEQSYGRLERVMGALL